LATIIKVYKLQPVKKKLQVMFDLACLDHILPQRVTLRLVQSSLKVRRV
jgi:hypothetical protein